MSDAQDDEAADEYYDSVAARCEAFRSLLLSLDAVADPALREEGVAMLRAVRTSFETRAPAELKPLRGGKT